MPLSLHRLVTSNLGMYKVAYSLGSAAVREDQVTLLPTHIGTYKYVSQHLLDLF